MSKEVHGYREELEEILKFTQGRNWIKTSEIAEFDYGATPDKKLQERNARAVRRRYQIENGGLSVSQFARKRALL